MKKFAIVAGLPRAGTTLACQILNSNPNFHVTPTSGILDMIRSMRSNFSQNVSFRTQDRLAIYNRFRDGLNGFLNGYFKDDNVVFDKCRGWTNSIALLDEFMQNQDTKIIWFYRDPVQIVQSIESQYQKTILMENMDESVAPGAFQTLDDRIGTYIADGGLIHGPVKFLNDAMEMGYGDRILLVRYFDLTNNTQFVMDDIHDFIGEPRFTYDLNNIKQTTFEFDGIYNYKFMHTIREGKIEYKQNKITIPQKYVDIINQKFEPLNNIMK